MKITNCKAKPYFEKNLGQFPSEVKYKASASGYTTYFTEGKILVSLPSNKENTKNVFSMKLENTNTDIEIDGKEKELGTINYLKGKDESKWITQIPTYSKIKYSQVYENIDLYYYINNDNLEYDFVLSKGANPKGIAISFEGLDKIEIDENNNLVLSIGDVKAKLLKPEVYQVIDNTKKYVDCEYILDNNSIKFLLEEYEKEYELVLDPVLELDYSTYIGSSSTGSAIALDSIGYVYITGYIDNQNNYPYTIGAYQTTTKGGTDIFVTKLDQTGSSLVYSTYIGGSGSDQAWAIAIDSNGCAYITGNISYLGTSTAISYPVTTGVYQTSFSGEVAAFVTKLNPTGSSLIYSTYIGGNDRDYGAGIAVDGLGYAYITGYTVGQYKTTLGAYQTIFGGNRDAFVTKLNTDGKSLIYSTYLGGSDIDYASGIAVDSLGYAYIVGGTSSTNYSTTKGAYQRNKKGVSDIFVTKLNLTGSSLIYSTYIGGTGSNYAGSIAIDNEGNVYITGSTSSNDYPTTSGAYQNRLVGGVDAIVTKLSSEGTNLIYSTLLGGSGNDGGASIAVDSLGCAYIVGQTTSTDYPKSDKALQTYYSGNYDGMVSKLNSDGTKLIYSTYMGSSSSTDLKGVVVDGIGNVYIMGDSASGYQTTIGSYQTDVGDGYSVVVSKIKSAELNIETDYKRTQSKLLDIITTNLNITNQSSTNLDINVKIQSIDPKLSFISNSLHVQGIKQSTTTIPSQIYISNVPPMEDAQISFDVRVVQGVAGIEDIPITIQFEMYDPNENPPVLLDTIIKKIYINSGVGPNYIPGCNQFYNLAINNQLQTTASGIPIIYYKLGTSYFYVEPNGAEYVYKALKNPANVTEYKLKI